MIVSCRGSLSRHSKRVPGNSCQGQWGFQKARAFKRQDSALPGGREPEAFVPEPVPQVGDVHPIVENTESGVEVAREFLRAAAPVISEETVASLRQVDEQGRGGDRDGCGVPGRV